MPQSEFQFEQDSTNCGRLTYRCLSFNVSTDNDDFTESELDFMRRVVNTLNGFFITAEQAEYQAALDEGDDDSL